LEGLDHPEDEVIVKQIENSLSHAGLLRFKMPDLHLISTSKAVLLRNSSLSSRFRD
jgi:hypothetical protein